MPTCAGTHWNTTLLLDRIHRLLCSCWVGRSMEPFVRDQRADRESESRKYILLVAVFLNQVFCGSFQGVQFCSVVGTQVTSWDGERGSGFIWTTYDCRHHCPHSQHPCQAGLPKETLTPQPEELTGCLS